MREFTHLHLHTSASLLDGVGKIDDYISLAKEYGHKSIAITDHGSLVKTFEFYKKVKSNGIKPIIGCEFYICKDSAEKIPNKKRSIINKDSHIIILAKNNNGLKNLFKLNYLSYKEGFYYKPRITFKQLFENKGGLIVSTACVAGKINQLNLSGEKETAEILFKKFIEEFGEDFYAEIQINELNDTEKYGINQYEANKMIISLADKYNVKILLTGDVHYAYKDDYKLQSIVINSSRDSNNTNSLESFIHAKNLYYHSSDDFFMLNDKFEYNYSNEFINQCMDNTLEVSKKCNVEFDVDSDNYPNYSVKDGREKKEYLKDEVYSGLEKKIEKNLIEKKNKDIYKERINHEIDIIDGKGFIDYFLIFRDIVLWAKNNNIRVGVARGSAAGSVVSFLLGITMIDPIKYNLYFERFLNPSRNTSPDIDLDIERGGREKIREWLKSIYGEDNVIGVSTWIEYQPKTALRDSLKAFNKDTSLNSVFMKKITKIDGFENTDDIVHFFNTLRTNDSDIIDFMSDSKEPIYYANRMLGLLKAIGTHAGGVVITPKPLFNFFPITKSSTNYVSAYREGDSSTKALSELGILKLDLLGLKTLNIIKECIASIKEKDDIDITNKIENLDLGDEKLYDSLRRGNNIGIFQMEGDVQDMLMNRIQVNKFDDIVAINAINRPGPLDKFGKVYAEWKKIDESGDEFRIGELDKKRYPFKFLKKHLKNTHGCLLYQEQFMMMLSDATGLTLGESDVVRRAIGWKTDHPKYYMVKGLFEQIKTKLKEKGYNDKEINGFIEYSRNFLGYSFNLSHSVSYSYTAMQTAFLKVYYKSHFYAALLNYEGFDKYFNIISNAFSDGIEIVGIDIKNLKNKFTAIDDDKIQLGLLGVKGAGEIAVKNLLEFDFGAVDDDLFSLLTVGIKNVNKKTILSLIKIGAFDRYEKNRKKVALIYELIYDKKFKSWITGRKRFVKEDKPSVLNLIDDTILEELETQCLFYNKDHIWFLNKIIGYIDIEDYSIDEIIKNEKDINGFSLSELNRIDELNKFIEEEGNSKLLPLSEWKKKEDVCYFYVTDINVKKTKNKNNYINISITDGIISNTITIWGEFTNIEYGKFYYTNLQKDKYGFKIIGKLTEIEF